MFYAHQLLARKTPLGQIWMAATMHEKMNRKKLDKLNIIKICEEILNPSIPMALRLSGILMEGVVIVYERKVKLLYDDVTRFLVEINQAWKVKAVPDPTLLPKGKSKAKKETVTLPDKDNDEINLTDIEGSHQFSNTATAMRFQHTMRLDSMNELFIGNGREEEDPELLHQADAADIILPESFESFQANAYLHNCFERFDSDSRFDIQDEGTQNVTSGNHTQIPTTLIPSPPHQDQPTRADTTQDQRGHPANEQSDEGMLHRQEPRKRGPNKRERGQPVATEMDYEQTIIPGPIYQRWLQDASDIVSRRGRKKKGTDIISSTKIANLMKLPPVVLLGNLFRSENNDIYYPAPILDLWMKSIQPPHDKERVSAHHPPEPSFSSPPTAHNSDFKGFSVEDIDSREDNQAPPVEKRRNNVLLDELTANFSRGPEATPRVSSVKAANDVPSSPSPASEGGPASHSDFDSGRIRKKRCLSSGNSSGGLEPVAENVNFKLARLSEDDFTLDQELLVESGPTQTQVNINHNHSSDRITDSIQAQMKAHFNTPGAPPVESLDMLAAGMTKKSAAQLFYQTCVLASRGVLGVEQNEPYGEILLSKGSKM